MLRRLIALALVVIARVATSAPPGDALIPREVCFGNPDRALVRISPDVKWLSYLAPSEGVLNVWVERLDGTERRVVTAATKRPIRRYFWAHNSEQIVFSRDRDGDENHHLHVTGLEGGEPVDLTPFENAQARLVESDRARPDEILVAINDRRPDAHDLWLINTRTGERERVFENDAGFAGFFADGSLQLRVATRYRDNGGTEAFLRDPDTGGWLELARWGLEDAQTSGPLKFSRDGRTLYLVDSRGVNTGRLHAFRLPGRDDDGSRVLLAADDRADVGRVIFDPATGRPQAAAFDYARREWRIIDPGIREDWLRLEAIAKGDIDVVSRNHEDTRWIVTVTGDRGPVEYHIYDRRSGEIDFLFSNRTRLAGLDLSPMTPHVITSRDGLPLVSYLTLPRGVEPRALPMVLLVHGGPWARDRWGYHPLHQWLASRGYAVLSVNFRGSTGFGKAFVNAGNHEWARAMHNDLIDAVIWASEQGIADPDRVAIMGGSYGGYATLVGLTFTPQFFAAGVDIVGPSDVKTLLESIPPYWSPIRAMFDARVGSLDNEADLAEISPLSRVDAIVRPLLIAQGANDPRVKEAQSNMIVDAMQAKGLPVTYVVFPDEGHGFARPENNLAFFAIAESFLGQHLGGKVQPVGSEIRASSADVRAGGELIEGVR